MLSWALAALLAAGGPPPVTARIWIPSRVALLPVNSSVRLLARVRIEDTGRVLLGCPSIAWEWGDGEVSVSEPTCLSAELAARAPELMIEQRVHPYRRAGTMLIRVRVFTGGRVWARAETTLEIHGRGE